VSERVAKLRAQRAVQRGYATRSCGTCNACCTVLGVAELDKPVGEPCKHLAAKGCGIYDRRPKSCREYHCLWRSGLLDGPSRPDRLGIVIDVSNDKADLLFAREVRPGAIEEKRSVLDKIAHDINVVIVLLKTGDEWRSAIGPTEKVQEYLRYARRRLQLAEGQQP